MAVVVIDETALRAIIGDDVELLRERLDAGADPARRDPDRGYTLLQVAAQQGAVDAGRVLLAAGADPNAIDGYGNGPHWTAVYNDSRRNVHLAPARSRSRSAACRPAGRTPASLARTIGGSTAEPFAAYPA